MGLHVQKVLGWPDEPNAVVGLDALAHHVHHGDGTTEIFHVTTAIGYGMRVRVVEVNWDERVEGFVAETCTAVRVETDQERWTG